MYKKFPLNIHAHSMNIVVTNSTKLNKAITDNSFVMFCPADDVDTFVEYVRLVSSFLYRIVDLKPYEVNGSLPDISSNTNRLYQASKLDFSIVAPQQTGRLVVFKEDFVKTLYKSILYRELSEGLEPFEGDIINDHSRTLMIKTVEDIESSVSTKFKTSLGISTVIFYKVSVSFEGNTINIDVPNS